MYLYENAIIANENACLAILKQREVVSCLAQLSSVLSKGLFDSMDEDICGMPQVASPDVAKNFSPKLFYKQVQLHSQWPLRSCPGC